MTIVDDDDDDDDDDDYDNDDDDGDDDGVTILADLTYIMSLYSQHPKSGGPPRNLTDTLRLVLRGVTSKVLQLNARITHSTCIANL